MIIHSNEYRSLIRAFTTGPLVNDALYNGTLVAVYGYEGDPCTQAICVQEVQTSTPRPLNSNISGGWVLVCAFLYRLLALCF